MTYQLSDEEYEGTRWKLANMVRRLAEQRARCASLRIRDHEAERSKLDMIAQYLREIHLYESVRGLPLTECEALASLVSQQRESELRTQSPTSDDGTIQGAAS